MAFTTFCSSMSLSNHQTDMFSKNSGHTCLENIRQEASKRFCRLVVAFYALVCHPHPFMQIEVKWTSKRKWENNNINISWQNNEEKSYCLSQSDVIITFPIGPHWKNLFYWWFRNSPSEWQLEGALTIEWVLQEIETKSTLLRGIPLNSKHDRHVL